jgi:predicted MarR family transcription regulator
MRSSKPPPPSLVPLGGRTLRPPTGVHLAADDHAAALTRLEMGVLRAQEAFASWCAELHKHSGGTPLGFQDIALLHCVRLRGGTPSLSDMLVFLHRTDLAALQYSFRKLERAGLVRRVKGAARREVVYDVTEVGRAVTDRYARLRQDILVRLVSEFVHMDRGMQEAATILERLVGIYDQATQSILNANLLARTTFYAPTPPPPPAVAPARPRPAARRPRGRAAPEPPAGDG